MSVVLAATWDPRGEAKRLRRLYPQLSRLFGKMVVVMPPGTHFGLLLSLRQFDDLQLFVSDNWPGGRRESLERAITVMPETSASHILYADMDRLLRWAETRYEELRQATRRVQMYDCLVIGRTEMAYGTHPQALVQTEAMSNRVFSHLLNESLDLSAGAKGFSLDAAKFVVRNAQPVSPFGADSEWVVLARRGGFRIRDLRVDGLDWESADRFADTAADADTQYMAAVEYDADPENWKKRVAVADEIILAGIDALKRKLE
ncbi:MAG: hypothetical protein AAF787_16900 [Chloroflexota bacterium]